jgi:signal transduction histidine kinase
MLQILSSARQVMLNKVPTNAARKHDAEIGARLPEEADHASMVDRTRLVLSISALLTILIDRAVIDDATGFAMLVLYAYVLHSLVIYILPKFDLPFLNSMLVHWLDVGWYVLIVFFSGGSNSFFFLFFFFAILASSFRWGFEEGAQITLASAVLFALTGLVSNSEIEIYRLLLRTTFVLALGYMIAYWGGAEVAQKRRLALLRDVSRLSNPRFGVDHTIATVLEKIRAFFNASSCILVIRDNESTTYSLRTAVEGNTVRSLKSQQLSMEAGAPLMAFPTDQIVVYTHSIWPATHRIGECMTYDHAQAKWTSRSGEARDSLAELLEARSFVTAPLPLRKGEGRIYVVSSKHDFRKEDGLFLSHIVAQTFPVIENMELLDRLASDAALHERKKIARDLHDTTIQSYIGLKHGLSAVRNKAADDNPLIDDLDKLTAMTEQVISDLRRYAGTFKNQPVPGELIFLRALRRQAARVKKFYGVDLQVSIDGELDNMNDRLAAEIFQIINEGMSNICRHTSARHGFVRIRYANGWIKVRIENECLDAQIDDFMPRSIAGRADALGGTVRVEQEEPCTTIIHVEIPA